ncbi:FAST kinase domain-containing protein 2, mitochondrial [Stigmatopora argus]
MSWKVMRRSLRLYVNSWKTFSDISRSSRHHFIRVGYTRLASELASLNRPVRFQWQDSSLGTLELNESDFSLEEGSSDPEKGEHLYYELLEECGSPSDVLELSQRQPPSPGEISNCLTRMWTSAKMASEEQRQRELRLMLKHPGFELLLQNAMTSLGAMQNEDVTYSLLSMVHLGVPEKSRVVQMYLRTCQERLNDFDEKSLSILASCLERLDNTANVDALRRGLRLLMEARLPKMESVSGLQTAIRVLGEDMPLDLKRKLERKAFQMTERFDVSNAQYLIITMAKMGFSSRPLLDICSQRIVENMAEIPLSRLLKVAAACRELRYKNLALMRAVSDRKASAVG